MSEQHKTTYCSKEKVPPTVENIDPRLRYDSGIKVHLMCMNINQFDIFFVAQAV